MRHLGLFGATLIGVGAIVGGGILALAGVAFQTAGPGALLAFVLNGGIAVLTAASFAEIARVARLHRCETVVLGAPRAETSEGWEKLEALVSPLDANVVILRAPRRWRIAQVRRVLVPLGGRGDHSRARARLLASLARSQDCAITFLRTLPPGLSLDRTRQAHREVQALARDEVEGRFEVEIEEAEDVCGAILRHAADVDLVVMGIEHARGTGRTFGRIVRQFAESSDLPLILIGARGRARH